MIVVTGATGQLGRLVITELLGRVPASEIVAATRHPENAADLSEIGVTVRSCDYDDPATLADAFEADDRVLLISSNDFVNSISQHTAVVEAAGTSDVSLLAYTSLHNAAQSRLIVAQPHRATEPVIRQSGVPYTLLRNNLYSEHFAPVCAAGPAVRDVRLQYPRRPGGERHSWRLCGSRRDGADRARARGTRPTSSVAMSPGATRIWWRHCLPISGTEIRLRKLSSDEHRQAITTAGFPAPVAEVFVNTYEGIADGQLAATDATLRTLIGRPTTTLAETLSAALRQSPVGNPVS